MRDEQANRKDAMKGGKELEKEAPKLMKKMRPESAPGGSHVDNAALQ